MMVREDIALILNDGSMVSSFGFEKNLSTITAWVLILLLSYDKSTIIMLTIGALGCARCVTLAQLVSHTERSREAL